MANLDIATLPVEYTYTRDSRADDSDGDNISEDRRQESAAKFFNSNYKYSQEHIVGLLVKKRIQNPQKFIVREGSYTHYMRGTHFIYTITVVDTKNKYHTLVDEDRWR